MLQNTGQDLDMSAVKRLRMLFQWSPHIGMDDRGSLSTSQKPRSQVFVVTDNSPQQSSAGEGAFVIDRGPVLLPDIYMSCGENIGKLSRKHTIYDHGRLPNKMMDPRSNLRHRSTLAMLTTESAPLLAGPATASCSVGVTQSCVHTQS